MRATRRRVGVVAGQVISAAAVWFVLQTIDVGAAAEAIGRANPVPLLAIVAVVAAQGLLRAWLEQKEEFVADVLAAHGTLLGGSTPCAPAK